MNQFWEDVAFYANLTLGSVIACYVFAAILLIIGIVKTLKSIKKKEKFQFFTGAVYAGSLIVSGCTTMFVHGLLS